MSHDSFLPGHEIEGESVSPRARHWRREHFIPISTAELIKALSKELTPADRKAFRELCYRLSTAIHLEFQGDLQHIKQAYEFVNPDKDTLLVEGTTDEEREAHIAVLFDRLEHVLERANFLRLRGDEVEQAIAAASDWGVHLNIDLGIFDRLEVYVRGDIVGRRVRRRMLNFYRTEVINVPIYQRVAAVFRLRDDETKDDQADTHIVYLKMLKNVPKQDVDMILPGSRIKMSMLDSGKILLPTLSGIVIALIKIFKGTLLLAFAGFYGMLAFLVFVLGTLAHGFKSFSGYRRIRDRYELNMTRSLYYQHLASNAGVLFRLIDEGEEQELREMIVAYFLLWREADDEGWTDVKLDQKAEEKLKLISQIDIDFEVSDALAKLRRFGLAKTTAGDRWTAVRMEDAIRNARQSARRALEHDFTV